MTVRCYSSGWLELRGGIAASFSIEQAPFDQTGCGVSLRVHSVYIAHMRCEVCTRRLAMCLIEEACQRGRTNEKLSEEEVRTATASIS